MKTFFHDEDGAVTVDWVVLTAACIGLVLGATSLLNDTTFALSQSAGTAIDDMDRTYE